MAKKLNTSKMTSYQIDNELRLRLNRPQITAKLPFHLGKGKETFF